MTHRESTITLIFSPITKDTFRNFLKDLLLIRRSVIESELQRERQCTNLSQSSDDGYARMNSATTLSLFQRRNMDEGVDRSKFTKKWVPIMCILMVISGVGWGLLKHAKQK